MSLDDQTIKERDDAEDAADKLASIILAEPIDWPDHGAKWEEAAEEAARLHEDIKELRELVRSACAIADRKGEGTAWNRFKASAAKLGLNGITARTYRKLPDDDDN